MRACRLSSLGAMSSLPHVCSISGSPGLALRDINACWLNQTEKVEGMLAPFFSTSPGL